MDAGIVLGILSLEESWYRVVAGVDKTVEFSGMAMEIENE